MKMKLPALGVATAIVASAAIMSSYSEAVAGATSTAYSPKSPMIFVTANIGRKYDSGSKVAEVMKRLKRNVNNVSNGRPRFIGWQEIDEADPANEMGILKNVYPADWGWQRTLYRKRSDGTKAPLKVPAVAHDAQKSHHRVTFGSSGMKEVSPTRWITITRFRNQKISHINTHFIAGAFNDCDNCAERRERWWAHWNRLKDQAAKEHNDGFSVVVTGDFNRRRVAGGWGPAKVHPSARYMKNGGLDHIVAVPRAGWKVVKPRYPDGSFKQGEWWIGIDSHEAHWVTVRFLLK